MNAKETKEKTQLVVEQHKKNTEKVIEENAIFLRIVARNKIQHAIESGEFKAIVHAQYLVDDRILKKFLPVIGLEERLAQEVREEFVPLGYEVSFNELLDQVTISWENA